jgi:glycosyltransferase involved in cell wall biosynthesis
MNMKVAYLTHTYPVYSTTFSIDEVAQMRERGVRLTVFSIKKPRASLVTDALQPELERTSFVRPVPITRLLRANLRVAIQQPISYPRTALRCIRANAVNVLQCLKGALHFLEAVELGERLVEQRYECLHVQFADTAATYAAVIYCLHQLPFSVAVHAHDIFEHRFTGRLIAFRIGDAAWIRVISDFNLNYLQQRTGINAKRMEVVRCGIDLSKLRRSRSRENGSRALIVSVGRLVPYKGHDVLIRACRQLKDWGVDTACKIVGDGTERKMLADLIEELDLTDNVELVGVLPHNEICQMLEAATVFALACRRADDGAMDGIPVAMMEAMAMELPVVTTAISGIPELVEHNQTGLIAAVDDAMDLGRRIQDVITDSTLAERLGRNAREKVETEFNQRIIGAVLADRICISSPSGVSRESAENASSSKGQKPL